MEQEISGKQKASAARELKIFISYSRKDLDFVDQLAPALETLGYTIIIDRRGIHGAERWEARLGQMILEADTIIFVLSPASAASDVCRWEVEQALARRKRIVPVVASPLGTVQPPEPLRDLNYVHFIAEPTLPSSGWGTGLARLDATLSVDINWLREHTRVAEMAERWEFDGQTEDLFVRGSELAVLRKWRDTRPTNAPELTSSQRAFLQASEEAETRRQDQELKRIEEIRAAQEARALALAQNEKAQAEREAALRSRARFTYGAWIGSIVFSVIIGFAGFRAYQNGEKARAALAQVNEERLLQGRLLSLARNRELPPPPYEVQILAQRYEGESPGHVGIDFDGVAYYGTYRFRAGASLEEFLAFLGRWARPLADRLEAAGGLAAASRRDRAFVEAWRALAIDPEMGAQFATQQTEFVKENLYRRLATRLASGITPAGGQPFRLDLEKRSLGLKAVFLSLVVQYGVNTRLISDAFGDFGDLARRTDAEIIERIFQFRGRVKDYFPGIETKSPGYIDLIQERNEWEKSDALEILRREPK